MFPCTVQNSRKFPIEQKQTCQHFTPGHCCESKGVILYTSKMATKSTTTNFSLTACKSNEIAVFSLKKLVIKACLWHFWIVFSSRIHSNATNLGTRYLDKIMKICSAVCHSPLCNLEVTKYCIHLRYNFFGFPLKLSKFNIFWHTALYIFLWWFCLCVSFHFEYYLILLNLKAILF